jgi:hypothetical protein
VSRGGRYAEHVVIHRALKWHGQAQHGLHRVLERIRWSYGNCTPTARATKPGAVRVVTGTHAIYF